LNRYEEIEVRLKEADSLTESIDVLELLLFGGYAVWEDDSLYSIKQQVDRFKGLKFEIYSKEHPPPHFHVSGGGVSASFTINNCEHMEGEIGGREKALIVWWHRRSKSILVETWNKTRPSDCPVGPIVI